MSKVSKKDRLYGAGKMLLGLGATALGVTVMGLGVYTVVSDAVPLFERPITGLGGAAAGGLSVIYGGSKMKEGYLQFQGKEYSDPNYAAL